MSTDQYTTPEPLPPLVRSPPPSLDATSLDFTSNSTATSAAAPVSVSPTIAAAGHQISRPPASEPKSSSQSRARKPGSRQRSIPIAFPPLFHPNTSSTGLIASTAEGKPIPVDGSTAAGRDSALRELNSHYPSRHRYAKSTGAQSTTYSQPVIVRTYPDPPSRPASATRGGGHGIGIGIGRPAPSTTSGASAVVRRIIPFANHPSNQPGMLSIARSKAKKSSTGLAPDEFGTRLPPVEAFSFKSFLANMEPEDGHDINADLDRIAEICARSRYSLSNQYEVHKAPHGSGDSFLAQVTSRNHPPVGPTLQAVSSDDERQMRSRRRRGVRRRSMAVGTLETIMSSSRSSDEDKSKKKKSAAEIAEDVRGRAAARRESGSSSPISQISSGSDGLDVVRDGEAVREEARKLLRRKSSSFANAVMESTKSLDPADIASPRNSATALLSEPAMPQTSTSHLEVRPAPEEIPQAAPPVLDSDSRRQIRNRTQQETNSHGGLLSSLTGWISWRPAGGSEEVRPVPSEGKSEAEGSLRELLRGADSNNKVVSVTLDKGKGVDRS